MRTYPFTFKGQPYKICGLIDKVKREWLDPIRAGARDTADRMLAKKLIDEATAKEWREKARKIPFNSEEALDDLLSPEGQKRLIGLLLVPQELATEEFVEQLYQESRNPKSSFTQAMLLAKDDSYPTPFEESQNEGEQSGPPSEELTQKLVT